VGAALQRHHYYMLVVAELMKHLSDMGQRDLQLRLEKWNLDFFAPWE
jgi:hypothetical protein